MRLTDTDRVIKGEDNMIHLFKGGEIIGKLSRAEAQFILEDTTAWSIFLDREFSDKIDTDQSPERLAYLAECRSSK
jgi:hypothetical protein